ncbi:MAG: hypothetical protein IJI09_04430 [Clostridia bacterium]|nr:hypothetical protein [Clostridia bacterium]
MGKIFSVQDRQDAFEYVLSAAKECGRIIALVQVVPELWVTVTNGLIWIL